MDCKAAWPHAHPPHLSLTLPCSRALLLLRTGTVHHFNGAQTSFTVTLTHPGREKKEGAAQGSRTWCFTWGGSMGLPLLTLAGWGPGLLMVNGHCRGQVSKRSRWDTSPKGSALEGFWKTSP